MLGGEGSANVVNDTVQALSTLVAGHVQHNGTLAGAGRSITTRATFKLRIVDNFIEDPRAKSRLFTGASASRIGDCGEGGGKGRGDDERKLHVVCTMQAVERGVRKM